MNSLLKPTTEVVNIDENIENGTYVIGTGMSGTKPFEYGILIQFKRYSYTVQIAIDIDSAAIAKRQMNNGRWNDWDFYVVKSDMSKVIKQQYDTPLSLHINSRLQLEVYTQGKVLVFTPSSTNDVQ